MLVVLVVPLDVVLVVPLASYVLYTILMLRQLWRVPRIREHYRRLPTRRELPVDVGYLQFGSFFFRRQDVIGTGATGRVYKGMYAGKLVAIKEMDETQVKLPSIIREVGALKRLGDKCEHVLSLIHI